MLGPPPAYSEAVSSSSSTTRSSSNNAAIIGASGSSSHLNGHRRRRSVSETAAEATADDPPLWVVDIGQLTPPPSYAESLGAGGVNPADPCPACSQVHGSHQPRRGGRRHHRANLAEATTTTTTAAPTTDVLPAAGRHVSSASSFNFRPPRFPVTSSSASASSTRQGRRLVFPTAGRDLENGRPPRPAAHGRHQESICGADRFRDILLTILLRVLLVFLFVVFLRILFAQLMPDEA